MAFRKRSSTSGYRRSRYASHFWAVIMLSLSILGAAHLLSSRSSTPANAVERQTIVAEYDLIQVPVPAQYVPAGTRVQDIEFKLVPYPRHQLPAGALLELEEVMNSAATASLPANLPLFRRNFTSGLSTANPVMEQIPPGMRAITIKVDATTAVEGWAGSGSEVDVLLITKDQSLVVAEKVRILSAERSVAPVQDGAPAIPSTATLLVTQEQALAINTAVPRGRIAFALRSIADRDGWSRTVFTADNLNRGAVGGLSSDHSVTGYASIADEQGKQEFALTNGKWLQTDVVPEGFLVGR